MPAMGPAGDPFNDVISKARMCSEPDNVNHPSHYMSYTGLETIDVIEAFTSDLTGMDAVCTANVIKYICRWKHKNGIEDLKKAQWYLNRLIEDNKPIERKSN